MNYMNYRKAIETSYKILISLNIQKLPVKIVRVCKALSIPVKLYESHNGIDGYCKMYPNEPFIFVNSLCSRERQRFVVAHELGHIVLGHIGKFEIMDYKPSSAESFMEVEANTFAYSLLAPACVLLKLGVNSPKQISAFCEVDLQSADLIFSQLMRDYRNKKTPLEQKLFEQFKNFIDANKL